MSAERVSLAIAGGIARLTFCNAARHNAVDLAFVQALAQAALDCQTDPSVRVILMRAEGAMFSVGGDIAEMVAERHRAERHVLEMASMFHLGIERLRAAPAPVIVALNGTAAGGGFSLVLGADMVVAARSARLVAAYTKSGLTPDGGATWLLPRLVGRQRAFELLATNRAIGAEEALALGLVARVVDDSALDAEAMELARALAALPGDALAMLKRQLGAGATASFAEQLSLEAGHIARSAASDAAQAALDTFLAKR